MNISSAAQKSGVPAKTIRYYESIGLIPEAERAENGYRDYDRRDVQRLCFIHRARHLGFSVKDVGNLLELWNDRSRASADVKSLALKHIQDIESRIEELKSIRKTLRNLTESCHGDDRPDCPILDGLAGLDRAAGEDRSARDHCAKGAHDKDRHNNFEAVLSMAGGPLKKKTPMSKASVR